MRAFPVPGRHRAIVWFKPKELHLRLTYVAYPQVTADVLYDDAVFRDFLMSLDGVSGIDFSDPAKLETYQQNFFSGVFGIDSAYLEEINKTLNSPIDM